MPPKTLTYSDELYSLAVDVRRATLRDELRRQIAREEAGKQEYAHPEDWFFATVTYVDLLAASPSGSLVVDGVQQPWPPRFETVMDELPAAAINAWAEEVYSLNPDWRPRPPEEKKASTPTEPSTGSSA
jgi:hypothetical protein